MNREEFYKYVELYHQMKNKKTVQQAPPDDDNTIYEGGALMHHGIIGQKWGVRRFQNPDGSLTQEGIERYYNPDGTLNRKGRKELSKNKEWQNYQRQRIQNMYNDDVVYDKKKQSEMMNTAKTTRNYDVTFLKNTQDMDMDDNTRNQEYAKYLKNPMKYVGDRKQEQAQTQQYKPNTYKSDQVKNEKKELRKNMKEAYKNSGMSSYGLLGGLAGWGVVNKAIDNLGIEYKQKQKMKELSSADWAKINEEIKRIRGKK